MILVMDIGNTNIKIGIFDGNELVASLRLSSSNRKTSDEYYYNVKNMLDKSITPAKIKGAIISSVNPHLNYTMEHMVTHYFKVKPLTVGGGIRTGLNIKYDNPKEVGADRIVNSVAAYRTYGGPCIVVDCGTATTFNAISEKGEFLGGAISFGLKASAEALGSSGAKLPTVELTKPETVINKTTISNMQSGIINGYIGMIEYIVRGMKSEFSADKVKVIATGGLSEIVSASSDVFDVVDRTLTLRGLNMLYNLNNQE